MFFNWTNDINSNVYSDALSLRKEVFVQEQNVPEELEIDDLESDAHHVVLYVENIPVGTARVIEVNPLQYKMQRVAVRKEERGKGRGAALIEEIENHVRALGGQTITLGAQLHALPFYERLGYKPEGEVFQDAGIPHRKMTKSL